MRTAVTHLLKTHFRPLCWDFATFSERLYSTFDVVIGVTALRLHKKEKVLEVSFTNGETRKFSAELLRVCSPSAENCSEGANRKVVAGRRHVGIMGLELVGNYAVRLSFDDLHNTGLYTWDYLHQLGHHKYSRAKQYIHALRQQGLSRDPRKGNPRGAK